MLAARFIVQEHQLRLLCIRIVKCGVDLRVGQIATRSQFGSVQLDDQLPSVQMIAFPLQNFFYASARPWSHMRFVHFNGSRNRLFTIPTTGEQEK